MLVALREQKEAKMKSGIYHRVQINLTYTPNHIEGSWLPKEQTRYIFKTNALGITTENTRIDDILETSTISAASTMSLTMPRIGLQRHVSSS